MSVSVSLGLPMTRRRAPQVERGRPKASPECTTGLHRRQSGCPLLPVLVAHIFLHGKRSSSKSSVVSSPRYHLASTNRSASLRWHDRRAACRRSSPSDSPHGEIAWPTRVWVRQQRTKTLLKKRRAPTRGLAQSTQWRGTCRTADSPRKTIMRRTRRKCFLFPQLPRRDLGPSDGQHRLQILSL